MALVSLSEDDFLKLGLLQSLHSEKRVYNTCFKTNLTRFKSAYYACPKTVCDLFDAVQSHDLLGDKQISNPKPTHMLLALRFLKEYPTKETLAGFGNCTEKTGLHRVWKYVEAIRALKHQKISWEFDEDSNAFPELYVATVDGVHCRICEPRKDPSSKWYSKKFNKAGLAYEIGIAVYHNRIVWVNGPFPAGENDKKIFDKPEGLASRLKAHQRVIGDEGYRGAPEKVSTRNTFDSIEVKEFKKRAKARHETINTRLKSFSILSQTFRTTGDLRLPRHKAAMEACCVIVQYELENRSPLFEI
eukprot:scaffold7476_cov68-Cylindrotheca_fusiformis.AAC.4